MIPWSPLPPAPSTLIETPAAGSTHSAGQRVQPPLVSVVIVNWNGGEMLHECLHSLGNCEGRESFEVIVVDNASSDNSWKNIPALPYPFKLLRNETNLGFAMACNQGAELSSGEFVLLLNPDSILFPQSISKVIEFLSEPAQANIGICGIQLEDERGRVSRTCSRLPTAVSLLAKSWRLDSYFPRWFPPLFMKEWDHLSTRDVEEVIGAFFLVRRDVWHQLGGLDERYFVYFEEVDFCERARQAGYRTVYFAGARARHLGGGSSKQIRGKAGFYNLRARLQYAAKHFSQRQAQLVVLHTLAIEPAIRLFEAAIKLKFKRLPEIWISYQMLWRDWLAHGIREVAIYERPPIQRPSGVENAKAA